MITRASQYFTIEGQTAAAFPPLEAARPATARRLIEIDVPAGLITEVCAPRGAADLTLSDEFLIFPGFIDCHVHAREDTSGSQVYKESFETAGDAALHGGVAAFLEMPNCPHPPVDDESYLAKKELTRKCAVDVLLYAGIGPDTSPLSFPVPYKVYMGPSVGELFFENEDALRAALARYAGQFVAFHAESPEVLQRCQAAPTHAERRPSEAEIEAIDLALRLGENYRLETHICHLSTAQGLELIRAARARGQLVTCEVTPHHLYYDQDNIGIFSRPEFLQCNPPIRSRLDRIALLEGLRSGDIDILATDHAPHTVEEKERGASGVTHLDTLGAFVFWLLDEGFSPRDVQRVCAENPGRLASRFLSRRLGRIEPGYCGSLTILKREPTTIRRSGLRTRAGWSAFEGQTFAGRTSHTIVRGKIFPQLG
ncbi:MAG: amidohydrolase family protein [Planctomycetes bacterium]|nr:amidohydrolase family protein [Planctomycetota bacterium]